MFDLKDAQITVQGTASVTVQNAAFNFENFLNVTTTFNAAAFGAGLLVDVWQANVARQRHEEQMEVLRGISEKLDHLNQTAEAILRKLDQLPEQMAQVLDAGLLKDDLREQWNVLDAARAQFDLVPDFRVTPEQWAKITEAFNFVSNQEYRASLLATLPRATELLNFLSAGRYQNFAATRVQIAIQRIKGLQEQIANRMADATAGFLKAAIDGPKLEFGGVGNYVWHTLRLVSDHLTVGDLREVSIRVFVDNNLAYEPIMQASWGQWNEERSREPVLQAHVASLKRNYVTQYNDLLEAFNNYSALRKPLLGVAECDFAQALAGTPTMIG